MFSPAPCRKLFSIMTGHLEVYSEDRLLIPASILNRADVAIDNGCVICFDLDADTGEGRGRWCMDVTAMIIMRWGMWEI